MSIYKIYKEGDDNFYIGSTNDFNERKNNHRKSCKTRNYKLYNYINENGGWECFKMEVLEYCLKYQEREIELIKQLQPPLNTRLYNCHEKEHIKKLRKKYHEENKDKVSKWCKKYHEENKDKILIRKKIYSEKNKDKIKAYQVKYKIYRKSWGGDERCNNNLLKISVDLFD